MIHFTQKSVHLMSLDILKCLYLLLASNCSYFYIICHIYRFRSKIKFHQILILFAHLFICTSNIETSAHLTNFHYNR